MIWFDLKEMEARLLKGEVSERLSFTYLLVQLALICVLLQLPFEVKPDWWIWLLVSLGVFLGGVSWAYKINQKGGNNDFLLRFVSISFVAVMRCLLLVLFISVVNGVYSLVKGNLDLSLFWTAMGEGILSRLKGFLLIFYFIYLIPAFKSINTVEAEGRRVLGERFE